MANLEEQLLSKNKRFVISISGPIGAGKSTLLTKVKHFLNGGEWVTINEPLDDVVDLLGKAYRDPVKYNLHLQIKFFSKRLDATKRISEENKDKTLFVSERTIYDDILFWNVQKRRDALDEFDDDIYRDLWKHWATLLKTYNMLPNLFVYLRPDNDECLRRVAERNRGIEQGAVDETISVKDSTGNFHQMTYNDLVIDEHDRRYLGNDYVSLPTGEKVKVLVLKTNSNFRDDPEEAKKIASHINQAVNEVFETI